MFDMCSFLFLFSVERSMKKETENGSCMQFFQQLDNLVWGAPLLVLLVGTGIYLTLRLGLLQIRYLPKAFSLDLYRR